MRGKATWLILIAVGAVVIAGVFDAVHSSTSNDRPSALSNATATVPPSKVFTTPDCTPKQLAVSIEVRHASQTAREGLYVLPRRRVVTTVVVRRVGAEPCLQAPLPFALKISDRKRRDVGDWESSLDFAAPFAPETERTVSLPDVYSCDQPGPFHAIASVGPYTARRNHLSYGAITCWNGRDSA
jgi:hypothetical protein